MKNILRKRILRLALVLLLGMPAWLQAAQASVPRHWVEVLLEAVEKDGRGPTIHSRTMFHMSAAMYDAWAIFDEKAEPWLLGQTRNGFSCPCEMSLSSTEANKDSLRRIAISYAAFRILETRFDNFSGKVRTMDVIYDGLSSLGLQRGRNSRDYREGSAIALGNYIGDCYLRYGMEDGAHEMDDYEDYRYEPRNPILKPHQPGAANLRDPNLWQPLATREYIQKRGGDPSIATSNLLIAGGDQVFLSAEWCEVKPFSLSAQDARIDEVRGEKTKIFFDPGPPPYLKAVAGLPKVGDYKWGFLLVALWSGQVDPKDSVYWDISPGRMGNAPKIPGSYAEFGRFYDIKNGGLKAPRGHSVNPATGKPYAANLVLRGDYTRVLAEYWADAINTATPPGHWFRILNDVTAHPEFTRKWEGKGRELSSLEWDTKAYFVLGGAMHDAAIAAWSVKGFYDYIRPISAIRYLGSKGQCSDPNLPSFDQSGLPLIPGKIELVGKKDKLAGKDKQHVGKIKLYAWRGPDAIENFDTDMAGVGWILAENWWPYQRYSVPTPNFAGYVSGHSTFSYAAAEVLTQITGDPFFPGGLAEYKIEKNKFLKFERGPSQNLTLQWATYHDAANETSLSRIWGGIHPPADDAPARLMGTKTGHKAYRYATQFFK